MRVIENELRKNPADFLVYTGDIAPNTTAGLQFAAKYFTFKRMGVPVRFTIGNHDFTKGKSGDDAYLPHCGPLWYSFDSNGVHFVVVPMIWDGRGQRSDKSVSYKIEDFARGGVSQMNTSDAYGTMKFCFAAELSELDGKAVFNNDPRL